MTVVSRQVSPTFVAIDEVLLLHALAILEFGGSAGTRDVGLLESAIAQPEMTFEGQMLHRTVVEMAAAYAFHLCQNHPFADGNKRTAWATMRQFLFRNGFVLRIGTDEAVRTMLDVAAGKLPKQGLANWIGERVVARPTVELREFFGSLSFAELSDTLIAVARSYKSGGPQELTAIINETSSAMPVVGALAHAYQFNRENNEQAIHYIHVLCALHRIAEEHGYEW
jgi:death on curing protein